MPCTESKILDEYSGMQETMAQGSQICEGDTSRTIYGSHTHCVEYVYLICVSGDGLYVRGSMRTSADTRRELRKL